MSVLEEMRQSDISQRLIPSQCPNCSSHESWIDVYGGGPHCFVCLPPPSPAIVKSQHRSPGGTLGLSDEELDREWNQKWRVIEIPARKGVPAKTVYLRRGYPLQFVNW